MSTMTVVVIVVLVLLALAVLLMVMRARSAKRREHLQERFGPEYDRAVEAHGDRKAAEKRLAVAADRRDAVEIRPLDPAERRRYADRWSLVQAAFVDAPAPATRDADRLVQAVMRDRGYPVDDFATRAEMLAADHPEVVEHYRAAHAVGSREDTDAAADTEDLRQAFVHYRALFELLLTDGGDPRPADSDSAMSRDDSIDLRGDRADAPAPRSTGPTGGERRTP